MPRLFSQLANWKKAFRLAMARHRLLYISLLVFAALFFGLGLYFIVALLSVDPALLKLAGLRQSWLENTVCHESCLLERQTASQYLVSILQARDSKSSSKLEKQIATYFFDSSSSLEFRLELIRILAAGRGAENPPEYLKDYLRRPGGEPALIASLIESFYPTAWLNDGSAMSIPDYYLDIIASYPDLAVNLSAIRALSAYLAQTGDFSIQQLGLIEKIVLSPATDSRLRASLVLLLADYYQVLPGESINLLRQVYEDKLSDDPISQAFAADILNRENSETLVLPPISEEQWSKYYNY